MKTNTEIQQEARRMIEQGQVYREEARVATNAGGVTVAPRVLARLPDSVVTIRSDASPAATVAHSVHRRRHIEAVVDGGDLVYRLIAQESERDAAGDVVRENPPSIEMENQNGADLLLAGYEQAEVERLSEAIFPLVSGGDAEETGGGQEAVAKVEEILETNLLAPSERLRTKAEIVEFLDGRLEARAFIARSLDRQCARDDHAEKHAERCDLRMTI